MGCSSLRIALVWVLSMGYSPSGIDRSSMGPPIAAWGPPQAAVWISAPLWLSMGYMRTTCFTIVFSIGHREISALAAKALLPPPS